MAPYSAKVAVIGAGAAGITAVRELRREGHQVKVFEQLASIGGVWVLDDNVESDPLGHDPDRDVVHSSMYDSLRVNLPRELMSFSDFPFLPRFMKGRSIDARRFPHHTEVRQYLEAFADHFGVRDAVQFHTSVTAIRPVADAPAAASEPGGSPNTTKWEVRTQRAPQPGVESSTAADAVGIYDAVVVCNGHYSSPRTPDVAGMEGSPCKCEHSHSYRRPDAYAGEDIAWDIAPHASAVILSAKSWMKPEFALVTGAFGPKNNMYRRPWLSRMHQDGSVEFEDGSSVPAIDIVMFCTGYHYTMPFLTNDIVETDRSHVRPLYQHLLHPDFGASLSFIGLPFKVVPFPQFEVQARLVARLLSGKATLPSQSEMAEWMDSLYRQVDDGLVSERHVHQQGTAQWQYSDDLASLSGCEARTPEWRLAMWRHAVELRQKYQPTEYRDKWDDPAAVAMAHAAFLELSSNAGKLQDGGTAEL